MCETEVMEFLYLWKMVHIFNCQIKTRIFGSKLEMDENFIELSVSNLAY